MESEAVTIIVQAGAVGLLFFVIWAVVFKALPENRRSSEAIVTQFAETLERHEEGHRDEVTTIINGHKEAMNKLAEGQDTRLEILHTMNERSKLQLELTRQAMRPMDSRTRAEDAA